MRWVPECVSSSHFEVLAHCMMLLLVEVCLNEHMDFIVPCPVPVKFVFAEGRDVGNIEPHLFLGEPGLLWWHAVKWWIVVWACWRRYGPCYLSRSHKGFCLDAPNLHYLACNLRRQERHMYAMGMYSALALENPSRDLGTVCGPCGLRARLCLVTVPSIVTARLM